MRIFRTSYWHACRYSHERLALPAWHWTACRPTASISSILRFISYDNIRMSCNFLSIGHHCISPMYLLVAWTSIRNWHPIYLASICNVSNGVMMQSLCSDCLICTGRNNPSILLSRTMWHVAAMLKFTIMNNVIMNIPIWILHKLLECKKNKRFNY